MSIVVEFEQQDDICILRVTGRLVLSEDLESLRAKADLVRSRKFKKMLADFTGVGYIDSTIIGFLVCIYTSVTKNEGGRFVLVAPNPRVRQVLELTRLNTVIPMGVDVDSGLAQLRASGAAA